MPELSKPLKIIQPVSRCVMQLPALDKVWLCKKNYCGHVLTKKYSCCEQIYNSNSVLLCNLNKCIWSNSQINQAGWFLTLNIITVSNESSNSVNIDVLNLNLIKNIIYNR